MGVLKGQTGETHGFGTPSAEFSAVLHKVHTFLSAMPAGATGKTCLGAIGARCSQRFTGCLATVYRNQDSFIHVSAPINVEARERCNTLSWVVLMSIQWSVFYMPCFKVASATQTCVPAWPASMSSILSNEPITALLPVANANPIAASTLGPIDPAGKAC